MSVAVLAPIALALLGGCGSSNKTATASSPAATASSPATSSAAGQNSYAPSATSSTPSSAPAALITTKHSKVGTILAYGPKRMTVYLFEADKGQSSSCSGECASVWPPVSGRPQATGQAMSSDLGTITRPDGTTQVTYKGHLLYLYSRDKDNGDAYGQGLKSFGAGWYVLAPSGKKIDTS